MNNPKPPTNCPQCRASMRRWALDYRNPKTDEEIRPACLRIAKSYRNGWLACAPGEAHARNRSLEARRLSRARALIGSAQVQAKGEIEGLNARLHSSTPASHA